jgi:hypothetical protein
VDPCSFFGTIVVRVRLRWGIQAAELSQRECVCGGESKRPKMCGPFFPGETGAAAGECGAAAGTPCWPMPCRHHGVDLWLPVPFRTEADSLRWYKALTRRNVVVEMLRADGVWALTAKRGAPAHVLMHAWHGLNYAIRDVTHGRDVTPFTDTCPIWNLAVTYKAEQLYGGPIRCFRSMRIDRITGSPDPRLWNIPGQPGHELRADNVIKQRQRFAFLMGTKATPNSSIQRALVTASKLRPLPVGSDFGIHLKELCLPGPPHSLYNDSVIASPPGWDTHLNLFRSMVRFVIASRTVLVWGWSGFGLGLVWVWSGFGLGLVWVWSGFGVGLVWGWSGVGVGLVWVGCGFEFDLGWVWVWPGFDLGLAWV